MSGSSVAMPTHPNPAATRRLSACLGHRRRGGNAAPSDPPGPQTCIPHLRYIVRWTVPGGRTRTPHRSGRLAGPVTGTGLAAIRPTGREGRKPVAHTDEPSGTRRDFLYFATAGAGAVAVGAGVWPLVTQMNPSADVRALSSIDVDISGVVTGTQLTVNWLGKPVFIRHRTEEEIEAARAVPLDDLVDQDARNANLAEADGDRRKPLARRGREHRRVAGPDRCLHPSGLRADRRRRRRFRRLVLPLPRLALRRGGPHPQRARAPENLPIPVAEFIDDTTIKLG
jgi:ubiquinol-cytochrome c reductase iron-sulfur subunit